MVRLTLLAFAAQLSAMRPQRSARGASIFVANDQMAIGVLSALREREPQ